MESIRITLVGLWADGLGCMYPQSSQSWLVIISEVGWAMTKPDMISLLSAHLKDVELSMT